MRGVFDVIEDVDEESVKMRHLRKDEPVLRMFEGSWMDFDVESSEVGTCRRIMDF